MLVSKAVLLASLTAFEAAAAQVYQQRTSDENSNLAVIYGSNRTITLKGSTVAPGVVVLDYGANVEGHPTFQVLSATGNTSVLEITYSETRAVLDTFYMVCIPLRILGILY
jgi:hypothetical protein